MKKKNVRIPGYRRRLLNLDCIIFFDIHSKQKSNIIVLTFLMYRKWCETTGRQFENA